ncbi:MAG TPA: transporter substrate-binding domain-containing protein [Legionella sp.]|nr:transporter substrate-binding domain-containing protein [Legionella sp.]
MNWIGLIAGLLIFTTTNAQTIIVGTAPENPPLSFYADNKNHFYGFEVDIMNEICHRINVTCDYKSVVVSSIEYKLLNNQIDFAIGSIVSPAKPLNGLVFSLPYLQSNGQFMTLKTSPLNTPQDILNKTIGIRRGALEGGALLKASIEQLYNQQVNIIEYPTMNSLLAALSNKKVDVIYSNELPIRYWYSHHEDVYKLIGNKIPMGSSYIILAQQKYAELMESVNRALLDMMADGTYLEIYDRYFSPIQEMN